MRVRARRASRPARHHRAVLPSPGRLSARRRRDRARPRHGGGDGCARRSGGGRRFVRADLPGAGDRGIRGEGAGAMTVVTAEPGAGTEPPARVAWRLANLLAARPRSVTAVGLLVLLAAAVELVPPLVIRDIVDRHLTIARADGLLPLALLYLAGVAVMQVITFLYGYLAAAMAQSVLSDLRIRLFAHILRLPVSYFDRVPVGDAISRCTADVETLDTMFSSGVAVLLANLVRVAAIAVAMIGLSPGLSVVAAVLAAPLVLLTRALQVRMRDAEREARQVIGAVNTRLQEDLRSIEVIRAFGREPEFIAGFRHVLARGLAASNRSTFYSALYPPVTAIVSAIAVAGLLTAGTREAFAGSLSLGTLTAFLLLLQRFFQPITALGEEWQTAQSAMAGAERIFGALALAHDELPPVPRTAAPRMPWAVVLRDVEFGYVEEHPILHRV